WTWTSADNLMRPEQLSRLVGYLQSHGEAAMVYADYVVMDSAGRPLRDPRFRPQNRRTPNDPEIHLPDARTFGESPDNFIGPCFLYRNWVGRLLGEYDPIQGIEDFDYWLRLGLVGRIDHLDSDEPLYEYRVHENTLSARAAELKIEEHVRELMDDHRARREFFARPWTIYADAATMAWLRRTRTSPHRVVPWSGQPLAPQADEKCLVLVHGSAVAPALPFAQRESGYVATAAWFSSGGDAAAGAAADVCFVEDELTAARLSLQTPNVFRASRGDAMLRLAVKWANARTFYESTRPAPRRVRSAPKVLAAGETRPRVLLQVDDFTQGGMEQVVLDLASSLREDRFDVSLLVLGQQGQDVARMRQAGIPVLDLPADGREERYRRLLIDQRVDLVNAHYSLFGAAIAAERGVPFIQTIHNMYFVLPPEMAAAYRAADAFTAAYVCVSQAAARCSDGILGLPVSKMVVVPNGVDIERLDAARHAGARRSLRRELGFSDDDFVFLNVSSLQPNKCQPMLAYGFAEVLRERPESKLVLVGRAIAPGYLERVRAVIAQHGLENSVFVAGHREDVQRFYWAADAFVLPSLCEGWSLALAEALAAGLPAIATSVGSAPELLPPLGGRLLRPWSKDEASLDCSRLDHRTAGRADAAVAELVAAMREFCRERPERRVPETLRRAFDRRQAYTPYGQLFRWVLAGGQPASARCWTAARLAGTMRDDEPAVAREPEPEKAVA
ncbi:MAG: glycosyltransferase, partial [Thermoguttaceae bacterium]